MLAQLRVLTRGWVARIFLGAIALMMAITLFQGDFLAGLTNMFAPQGVAQVGAVTITDRELQREFDLFLRSQQRQGHAVTRPDAIRAHLPERMLDSIIQRRAMHAYAAKLGVRASDAQAADAIRAIPAAQNTLTGRFDRQAYQSFLGEIGYTTGEFETEIKGDLAADTVMRALSAGLRAPTLYGELVLAFQSERRRVMLAQIPAARAGAIPTPTEAQLRDFYSDSAAAFRTPEYRAATIVFARGADFAARVNVTEERLRQEYEARRATLTTPEKRTYVQISAPDEAKARQAADRLNRGEAADAVARALGLQMVRGADKAQAEIPDPAVRQAVFAAAANAPARAVTAQLSPWAVVKVESVTAGETPSFETERENIRTEIAGQEAAAQLDAAIQAFEEARSSGTAIAEAARAQNLAVVTIPAVDAQGRTPEGAPAEALVDSADLVRTIFASQEGEATDFAPVTQGVDALVQVDRVIPAGVKPFASVHDQLVSGWTARERTRLLREIATRVQTAVAHGQNFAAAARAEHAEVMAAAQTLDRATASRMPDQQTAQGIFDTAQGAVGTVVRPDGSALLLIHVEAIEHANPAQNAEAIERFRQQVQEQLGQSLVQAAQAQAVTAAHVRRNPQRLAQLFPADDQQTQQSAP